MADYMTLLGAEQVQSAANTMRSAADEMSRAASTTDGALDRHCRFLDDWLSRFEQVVERPRPPNGLPVLISDLLTKIEALKAAYPPPDGRGQYAAQTALFDLYLAADAINGSGS